MKSTQKPYSSKSKDVFTYYFSKSESTEISFLEFVEFQKVA